MSDTKEADEVLEQEIAEYLATQPDFFLRHPELLEALQIPHETGTAVSLIEHQVKALQKQSAQYRTQLAELIEVARENERLNQRLHQLTLNLLLEPTGTRLLQAIKILLAFLLLLNKV